MASTGTVGEGRDGNVGAGGTADGSAGGVLWGAHAAATNKMPRIISLALTCVLPLILVFLSLEQNDSLCLLLPVTVGFSRVYDEVINVYHLNNVPGKGIGLCGRDWRGKVSGSRRVVSHL